MVSVSLWEEAAVWAQKYWEEWKIKVAHAMFSRLKTRQRGKARFQPALARTWKARSIHTYYAVRRGIKSQALLCTTAESECSNMQHVKLI
jgi:hypothetical protein